MNTNMKSKPKLKVKLYCVFGKKGNLENFCIAEFADDMKSNDLEFYYFMRYGKVPLRFTNPEAVVESDNCEYKQRKSIKILKALVAGFALLFFTILFLIMFISALKVDPDFVNQANTNVSQS